MEQNNEGAKMNFENLKANTMEAEEEEAYNQTQEDKLLNFVIVSNINNLKNKEFSLTFKQGQDFEFVKYAIAKEFENLYLNDSKIITLYSICDLPIGEKDVIKVEILE